LVRPLVASAFVDRPERQSAIRPSRTCGRRSAQYPRLGASVILARCSSGSMDRARSCAPAKWPGRGPSHRPCGSEMRRTGPCGREQGVQRRRPASFRPPRYFLRHKEVPNRDAPIDVAEVYWPGRLGQFVAFGRLLAVLIRFAQRVRHDSPQPLAPAEMEATVRRTTIRSKIKKCMPVFRCELLQVRYRGPNTEFPR
jgi:hypothetical protein